jgi:DNA-directed RNA polymerase subunit RPC12/RpoP
VPEQFVFRCRTCGRVAPETAWVLLGRTPWADALNVRRYPRVRCPGCEGRDIDMNHGLQVEAEPTFRLHDPPRREPPRAGNEN